MARGRVISKSLGSSRRFRKLLEYAGELGEFAQALYPLMVAHADDFGRMSCDAFTVKHEVFPTSPRSEEEFDRALNAMHTSGLIVRYVVSGEQYTQIDKFEEHQSGLHKRTASKIPGPPEKVAASPATSGNIPEIPSELKGTELNRTERKVAPSAPPHSVPLINRASHRSHAFCGHVCVPAFMHEQFVRQRGGGQEQSDEVRAWYLRVDTEWAGKAVGDSPEKFWQARFTEWVGTTTKPAKGDATEQAERHRKLVEQKSANVLAIVQGRA